jgi:hypothetical protein
VGLSRGHLLGAAAVLAAGPALKLVPEARAATPSDNDLAYARLLVAAELLALDFYARAIGSRHAEPGTVPDLRRSRADEHAHYRAVAAVLLAAGQTPATAADIDFVYPRLTFASRKSIAAFGARLESLFLGAYLGAVAGFEDRAMKLTAARIAACEAQHLSVFTAEANGRSIGAALPRALTIDRASDALDAYTA